MSVDDLKGRSFILMLQGKLPKDSNCSSVHFFPLKVSKSSAVETSVHSSWDNFLAKNLTVLLLYKAMKFDLVDEQLILTKGSRQKKADILRSG